MREFCCSHDNQDLVAPASRLSKVRSGLLVTAAAALAVLVSSCGSGGSAVAVEGPVRVEIISLDHAPIRPATEAAAAIAGEYGGDVAVSTYHFDTADGAAFAEDQGLTDHVPIAIFINGRSEFEIDGRSVSFSSFPQGDGTGVVADGDWTMDDLRLVLDRAVAAE